MAVAASRTATGNEGAAAAELAIETVGLRMRYGAKDVLRGVDLQVPRGQVIALLGPNGAGKTTTIEILEGFRGRSAGEVRVLGVDPADGDEYWRARVGIVLQSWRDHGTWRVRDLLHQLGRYYTPFSTPERSKPYGADELMELVGLTAQATARAGSLSGGQRRRLDVAIGIVGKPDLLFLDEPTVGFDPQARQEFHELVHRLANLEETTILLTTHDLEEAEKLSDRIVILAGGKIMADGTAAELGRQVAGQAEIKYSVAGQAQVDHADDATAHVRELFARHGDALGDLEVHKPTLEDIYMTLVREFEAGRWTDASTLPGVTR
ncbi:ABC transporter ATP-binding protein [Kribbella sandramycini]|uniref:ABC transporter ATP-binding protein n=1 Tax=Kribbella sandramycini TaxID=60450 RepID=A0A7Y4NY20_9ACTN|nr:ABC transporter ATP-binding protein [Kribbella sandramycini]MBB6569681.1 ABC-2 type transport system ATP-binding protein [Kribbella sandramycini]NOL40487.1 ABC transporter ATP-binding protein [Kribbella sandramycini]